VKREAEWAVGLSAKFAAASGGGKKHLKATERGAQTAPRAYSCFTLLASRFTST